MNAQRIFNIINDDKQAVAVLASIMKQAKREGWDVEQVQKARDAIALLAIYLNPAAMSELSEQVWNHLNNSEKQV